ncbi:restriction endonuclease [Psychrobacter sp. DM8]|uniref:restriction endonuclease n=1 Tax=Psychrobacter sp. DM8 TaxID=3440636 RepID=UPI003F50B7A1
MSQQTPSFSNFLAEYVNYLLQYKNEGRARHINGGRVSQSKLLERVCERLNFNHSAIEFKTIKLTSDTIVDNEYYYYQTYEELALEILIASGYVVKKRLKAGTRYNLSDSIVVPLKSFDIDYISIKALRVMASSLIHNHLEDLVYHSKNGYCGDDLVAENMLVRIDNMMKKMYGKDGDPLIKELIAALKEEINWILNSKGKLEFVLTDFDSCNIESKKANCIESLKNQLLEKIKSINPEQFEKLSAQVIYELFPKANVGNALVHNGKSGDMGIDCIVTVQDYLGHPVKYYIQCKRYTSNNIGSPDLQNFIGSLAPYSLRQGIFMTTAKFTKAAYEYHKSLEHQYTIRLIDGDSMVSLMIENRIGVIEKNVNTVLAIDESYFNKLV